MGRHVVRPFHRMNIRRVAVWSQSADESLEVGPYAGIRIFRDQERGAGVANKYLAQPGFNSTALNQLLNLRADFVKTTARRVQFDGAR